MPGCPGVLFLTLVFSYDPVPVLLKSSDIPLDNFAIVVEDFNVVFLLVNPSSIYKSVIDVYKDFTAC